MTSDERLKDSKPYEGGLNEVLAITPIRYKWNEKGQEIGGDESREFVGFGAQDVQKSIPEAVVGKQTAKDGTANSGTTGQTGDPMATNNLSPIPGVNGDIVFASFYKISGIGHNPQPANSGFTAFYTGRGSFQGPIWNLQLLWFDKLLPYAV